MKKLVPFNQPPVTGAELRYISEAISKRQLAGNGAFTQQCQSRLREQLTVHEALLSHSCTGALELAAILSDLVPGDEVIMPSYTFVSTANAVVLRGAVPVFVDIRSDTLNLDETCLEECITPRTRAILPVHYAGVCAEMDAINALAAKHDLIVIEDAAHALLSTYRGRPAGSLGHMGCFSFHATKNIVSGEGGVFVTNDKTIADRAAVVWEKGTNRRRFFEGEVDKYTWVDLGSSFVPSELTAAFLLAQLEEAENINSDRLRTWNHYHSAFSELENLGLVRRPIVPRHCEHNGHLYYLLMSSTAERDSMIAHLAAGGIAAQFHYVPLHSAPAGLKYGRAYGDMSVTDDLSSRILRLPLYYGMSDLADEVIDRVSSYAFSPSDERSAKMR